MSNLLSPYFHVMIACKDQFFADKLGDKFKRRKGFLSVNCVDTLEDAEAGAKPESTLFIMEDRVNGAQSLNDFKRFCDAFKKWAVLMLTNSTRPEHVNAIREMKSAGCILRDKAGKELKGGVTVIRDGEPFYSAQLLMDAMNGNKAYPQYLESFVNRESETFYNMCKRLRCKEMAEKMELGEGTVRIYRSDVIKKVAAAGYKDVLDCGRFFGIVED